MSSTNRSEARQRHKSDYYITPVKNIKDFLVEFNKCEDIFKHDIKILDPCSGGSEGVDMSYPLALSELGVDMDRITTIDIREDSKASIKEDYLDLDTRGGYDVIITNPPFNISRDIIDKALDDVKDGGFVIMLLRLNYFGGQLRKDLWDTHMPKYSFVHNKRISFTPDGKTDSIEYQHCVWQKGYHPDFTKLMVI